MKRLRSKYGTLSPLMAWTVVLGMILQFAVAPGIAPEARVGGLAKGITECANSGGLTCDAEVTLLEMSSVPDVDEGDDVHYGYFVYWYDNRTGTSLPQAYHYFSLTVTHQGSPQSDTKGVCTYGSTSGSDYLEVTLQDVDENVRVYVLWYASIDVNNGDCTDTDFINTYQDYT
ncbi:MAG: hypothetical protein LN417_06825 [Candidatus Thermoplasmatota archaeon]|nr:hypothetical protein [Candidatus Thermoplasmatota archaeon]